MVVSLTCGSTRCIIDAERGVFALCDPCALPITEMDLSRALNTARPAHCGLDTLNYRDIEQLRHEDVLSNYVTIKKVILGEADVK